MSQLFLSLNTVMFNKTNKSKLKIRKNEKNENKTILLDDYKDESDLLGRREPKILLTTSRNPSSRLASFTKELSQILPNSKTISRGGREMKEIVDAARSYCFTDLIIVHEHRGKPNGLVICHLPRGPSAYFELTRVITRHDIRMKSNIGTFSGSAPHLIFEGFRTNIGYRVKFVLQHLFPVPKERTNRVLAFISHPDYISFRHYSFNTSSDSKIESLMENGPRFEMLPYQFRHGTVDQLNSEIEWARKPYIRNSKRPKLTEPLEETMEKHF